MNRIRIGMNVVDIAELHVGMVSDIRNDCFRVDSLHGMDMWLGSDGFLSVESAHVRLVCEGNRANLYEINPPLLRGLSW